MSRDLQHLGVDLRLRFDANGGVDLDLSFGELTRVEGLENLNQALSLRLLTTVGELTGLGHPRYGSRVRELVGATLDRPNLELLRRLVRQTLLQDPRVGSVTEVLVERREGAPGVVDVLARARAVSGEDLELTLTAELT